VTDWASTQREDEIVDLWPEHAQEMIGAMEFRDENHKSIVIYLDVSPLGLKVEMVTYMVWKAPFTGREWLDEIYRRDNLIWTQGGFTGPIPSGASDPAEWLDEDEEDVDAPRFT
jgi:hypothetical protein